MPHHERKVHVKAWAKPVHNPDKADDIGGGDFHIGVDESLHSPKTMGISKDGKSYAAAAAEDSRLAAPVTTATAEASSHSAASSSSAPPTASPPVPTQSRGKLRAHRTPAARPDPAKANKFDAITEEPEPTDESGESAAENGPHNDGHDCDEAEKGELDKTPPTEALRTTRAIAPNRPD